MIDGFKALESTPYLDFGVDEARRLLVLIRTPASGATASELERAVRAAQALVGDPMGWSVLFDVRASIGRSDPEFERDAALFRAFLLDHYERTAILVRSAVGELQVQRIVNRAERMAVFRDLDEALAFLTG